MFLGMQLVLQRRDFSIQCVQQLEVGVIGPKDKFLIFASDGLWDRVTNQEAAEQ
ncbi:hypothetical protein Syun_002084 [Stephania yunnanensis]|uniref:PPM-type phosphatase domain-containing protein n=1 Tax=Stephania yunnanensis TaxID=152371 RepID=A0AAP0Q8F9_9MAGN